MQWNWVYFFKVETDGLIKIGETGRDLQSRQRQLECGGGLQLEKKELTLLAAVGGTRDDEQTLHRHFAADRFRDGAELFRPSDALTDYLRWLRAQPYTTIDMDDQQYTLRSAGEWLPASGRSLAPPNAGGLFADHRDNWDFPDPIDILDESRDCYFTPRLYIDAARNAMGGIDLDPASHREANVNVEATTYYTIDDDGLTRKWFGRVWLNPPFSTYEQFCDKLLAERAAGNFQQACVEAPTRKITAKFMEAFMRAADAICIIVGRHSHTGRGNNGSAPECGYVILYFGDRVESFCDAFTPIGIVYKAGA